MARLSDEMQKVARDKMSRAAKRMDGAAAAIARKDITEGEFDNHFDGAVSAIFHIADALELVRTGVHRKVGEGDEATGRRSSTGRLSRMRLRPAASSTEPRRYTSNVAGWPSSKANGRGRNGPTATDCVSASARP